MVVTLTRGQRYRIFYRVRGVHRSVQEFTALYLGEDREGRPQFSLRPLAGTSWLNWGDLLGAERVADSTPPAYPRRSARQTW